MLNTRALGGALCAVLLLLSTGCGAGGAPGAEPGQLRVVAAFYPLQFLAERVAGPHAQIDTLTQPGVEPHDLELTPRQIGGLSDADLVVYQRGFQPTVDKAIDQIDQNATDKTLDVTTVVAPRELGGEPHEHGTQTEGHDHGGEHATDPHLWLDPTNMIKFAEAISGRLASADPEHAADYRANLATLTTELGTLDTDFRSGLARCDRTAFITSHAAFGYLAQRYGLQQIPIAGLSPDTEPSPARIAEIHREATEHKVTTIFYETLVSDAIARSIATDLKLKTAVLDPVEGITDASAGKDYPAVMRANLAALRTANGCR